MVSCAAGEETENEEIKTENEEKRREGGGEWDREVGLVMKKKKRWRRWRRMRRGEERER